MCLSVAKLRLLLYSVKVGFTLRLFATLSPSFKQLIVNGKSYNLHSRRLNAKCGKKFVLHIFLNLEWVLNRS